MRSARAYLPKPRKTIRGVPFVTSLVSRTGTVGSATVGAPLPVPPAPLGPRARVHPRGDRLELGRAARAAGRRLRAGGRGAVRRAACARAGERDRGAPPGADRARARPRRRG